MYPEIIDGLPESHNGQTEETAFPKPPPPRMPQSKKIVKKSRIETPKPVSSSNKGKGKQRAPPLAPIVSAKIAVSKTPKTKKVRDETPEATSSSFKIVAGSYEKLLYGLSGTLEPSTSSGSSSPYSISLKPIFIFPAHVSYIKAVAVSPNGGKWLATGSADEIIKVWDLRRKKEVGGLMHHEGTRCMLSPKESMANGKPLDRINNASIISYSISSVIFIRGWISRVISYTDMDGPTNPHRPYRPCQLIRDPPIRKTRAKRRSR